MKVTFLLVCVLACVCQGQQQNYPRRSVINRQTDWVLEALSRAFLNAKLRSIPLPDFKMGNQLYLSGVQVADIRTLNRLGDVSVMQWDSNNMDIRGTFTFLNLQVIVQRLTSKGMTSTAPVTISINPNMLTARYIVTDRNGPNCATSWKYFSLSAGSARLHSRDSNFGCADSELFLMEFLPRFNAYFNSQRGLNFLNRHFNFCFQN